MFSALWNFGRFLRLLHKMLYFISVCMYFLFFGANVHYFARHLVLYGKCKVSINRFLFARAQKWLSAAASTIKRNKYGTTDTDTAYRNSSRSNEGKMEQQVPDGGARGNMGRREKVINANVSMFKKNSEFT